MPRKCLGVGSGANTSGPDLCVIPYRLDRMSAGQTGHFHGKWGCLAEFLSVYWFFLLPDFSCFQRRPESDLLAARPRRTRHTGNIVLGHVKARILPLLG